MRWLKIPENTRIKMKSEFRNLILKSKGGNTWDEFQKRAGVSKYVIQNYICGKNFRYNPDIKTLKKLIKNLSISPEDIEKTIAWNESLKLLSLREPELNDVIIKERGGSFIDLEKFCRGLKVTGSKDFLKFPVNIEKVDKNHIKIWYITSGGQTNPKEIKINKKIPLDEEMLIIFGLIQAESTKQLEYLSFQFSNSDPQLILKILEYFERYWDIPRNLWVGEICYWRKDFKDKKAFLRKFWYTKTRMPKEKTRVREGTKYRLSEKASKYGVCSLRMNIKVFSTVVLKILYNIMHPLVETDKKYAGWYLRGLFEGDGFLCRNRGKFRYTGIAFNPNSDELNHYQKILENLGISIDKEKITDKNRRAIIMKNWRHYYKLLKATDGNLFLNKQKNRLFVTSFLNNQYVKPLTRLRLLRNYQPITVKIYSEEFKCTTRSAIDGLKRLEQLKLLKCDRSAQTFKFYLTNNGKEFLNLIEKLERVVKNE